MKTNNAYTSRYRVRKSGVIQRRKQGQNHFNAKHPRRKELTKHGYIEADIGPRDKRRYLPGT